jgi:hypothetical protein
MIVTYTYMHGYPYGQAELRPPVYQPSQVNTPLRLIHFIFLVLKVNKTGLKCHLVILKTLDLSSTIIL